jgi:hypothetical protein
MRFKAAILVIFFHNQHEFSVFFVIHKPDCHIVMFCDKNFDSVFIFFFGTLFVIMFAYSCEKRDSDI